MPGIRSALTEVQLNFRTTLQNVLETQGKHATNVISQRLITGRMATGVNARQTNRAWEDYDEVITAGNTVDIDLYGYAGIDKGAGLQDDFLGQPLVMEEVVILIIEQKAGPGRLEIMPTVPATGISWIGPQTVANGGALKAGGVRVYFESDTDALDLMSGVSQTLRLGANGGDVLYNLFIAGRHDDDASSSSS